MSFIKRAWLSIIRKKGKSALLFSILLVVATLALSGISIKNASGQTSENLRKTLGGGFVMEQDTSDPTKQQEEDMGNGATASHYVGERLTKEIVEKVAKVPGVKNYNAELVGPAVLKRPDGKLLSLRSIEGSHFANDESMNSQITLNGVTRSEDAKLFSSGTLKLVEGRHITAKDKNAIMIHKEIAEKNHLKIGDKIFVSMNKMITGGKASDKKLEVTIVGIFDSTVEQQVSTYGLPGELMENNAIMDVDSAVPLYSWIGTAYSKVHFAVNDPAQLENVIEKAKKLDNIDQNAFTFSPDNNDYQSAAEPLKKLDKLITTLLIIIVSVCAAVLCLLLTMWTKGRVHEAGILLSMGISKYKIIFQHMVEVAIIAALAFGISYFSSTAVAQGIGNTLLGEPKSGDVQQPEDSSPDKMSFETPIDTTDLVKLKVTVKPNTLWQVFGIGGTIILVSVLVSSIQILRVKPKELLTKTG